MANVFKTKPNLTPQDVLRYRQHIPPEKVSSVPPFKPTKNEVYIFKVDMDTSREYWRKDGYNWRQKRSTKKPNVDPTCEIFISKLKSNGVEVDFFRKEYYPLNHRLSPPNIWASPYIIVHYCGSFDPKISSPKRTPHGNAKLTPQKKATLARKELFKSSPVKAPAGNEIACLTVPPKTSEVNSQAETVIVPRKTFDPDCVSLNLAAVEPLKLKENDVIDSTLLSISQLKTYDGNLEHAKQKNNETCFEGLNHDQSEKYEINSRLAERSTNWNSGARGYVRTESPVRDTMYNKLNEHKTPAQVQREMNLDFLLNSRSLEPGKILRNRKQIYNAKYNMLKEAEHDDLYETYLFGRTFGAIIPKMEILPHVLMVVCHPEMDKHLNSVQRTFKNLVCHYDTTFEVGTFFASIVSFIHPGFKEEPIIPYALLLHDSTKADCHDALFKLLASKTFNSEGLIIVTDRERSIVKAIQDHLPNARNVFCWNHIRRNVKRWAETHNVQANTTMDYTNHVIHLLNSTSSKDYQNSLETFKKHWHPDFDAYYMTCLHEDVQKCFRPQLESLGIYNFKTGITNNAAESANAAFKRAIGVRPGVPGQTMRQNFFQAVSLWYFYQTGRLSDIMLGLQSLGDLHMKDSIGKLYAPENIRDVVNQDVIASLVLDGKYPEDMPTKRQYTSKNFFELTTLPGLAKWFVEENRVTLYPRQHVFVVTDLLDTQYMVNLQSRSCSCKRLGTCSHLMAAQMSVGIYSVPTRRKCKPNIGKLYRSLVNRAVGTKRGQTFKQPGAKRKRMESFSRQNENDRSFVNEFDLDLPKALPALIPVPPLKVTHVPIPRITRANHSNIFLKFPTGAITMTEIKCLNMDLNNAEIKVMKELLQTEYVENLNWFVDTVIDAFFLRIADMRMDGNIAVTAPETLSILNGNDCSNLFLTKDEQECFNWNGITNVFLPVNQDSNHWVLVVMRPAYKEILVLDPIASYKLNPVQKLILEATFNPKFGYGKDEKWKICTKSVAQSTGKNALQCGPFICFYAEAIVNGWSLEKMPDLPHYRHHVTAIVIGNCVPKSVMISRKYASLSRCCKNDKAFTQECFICGKELHQGCAKQIFVRGSSYMNCP